MARIVWSAVATAGVALLLHFQPWIPHLALQESYRAETEPSASVPGTQDAPSPGRSVEDSVPAVSTVVAQAPCPQLPAAPGISLPAGMLTQPPPFVPQPPPPDLGVTKKPAETIRPTNQIKPIGGNTPTETPAGKPATEAGVIANPITTPKANQPPQAPPVPPLGSPPPNLGNPPMPPPPGAVPVQPGPPLVGPADPGPPSGFVPPPPPKTPAPTQPPEFPAPTPTGQQSPPPSVPPPVQDLLHREPEAKSFKVPSYPPTQPKRPKDVGQAAEATNTVKTFSSPWSFHLEIVDGKNLVTAKMGKSVQFRVVCEKVEIQSPAGSIQASGSVRITSQALEASCDRLTIQLQDEAVLLEGSAQMKCQHDGQELDLRSDRFSLKLSDIHGKGPAPATPPPSFTPAPAPGSTSSRLSRPPIISGQP